MNSGESIQQKILLFLADHPHGANAIQIAEGIGHNRITVGKYLDVLKAVQRVDVRSVGQANLWSTAVAKIRPKILVVDDEEPVTNLVKLTLGDENYEMHVAHDGEEALEKVLEIMPDLIVLDIMMPKKDGIEVCKLLKDNILTRNICIVLLSAKSQTQDKVAGMTAGADYYMTKPFDPQELEVLIKTKLRKLQSLAQKHPVTGLDQGDCVQAHLRDMGGKQAIRIHVQGFEAFVEGCGFKNSMHVLSFIAKLIQAQVHKFGELNDYIGHIKDDELIVISKTNANILQQHIYEEFNNALPFLLAGKPELDCTRHLQLRIEPFDIAIGL